MNETFGEPQPPCYRPTSVKKGQVALTDGNKYFNRSGTTIVKTVEILAEVLHGDQSALRWHDEAWWNYRERPKRPDMVLTLRPSVDPPLASRY